jgi:ABC-type transport system involved in multi-copper enzyme maturation permease subunit
LRLRNRRYTPFVWLVRKEWRELVASRSWWVMLLVMGPLVGVSFISAVRTYAEASGLNGTAVGQGVGEAFSPLVGVWAPTFSACELAAAFLLPFVGIRLVSGDRQSGALKIELQHPMSSFARMSAKALVLVAGWLIASAAPALAVVLWRSYGGSVYPPELATVVLGHMLNAGLTIALAASIRRRRRSSRSASPSARGSSTSSPPCTAASGSAPPATRRPRWWRSSSTG